jgi:hypothetical protein
LGGRQPGDGEMNRGRKMQQCGMKVKVIESMQTCTLWTVERERNPVVVVVWSEEEGIRQEGRLGVRTVWSDWLLSEFRKLRMDMNVEIPRRLRGLLVPD